MSAKYFVYDTETTGINPFEDRIVQFFGATADKDGNLIDEWEIFINPGIPVPEEAAEVHGFSDEFLAEHGEEPEAAFLKIRDLFLEHRNLTQVAFNLCFDLTFIDEELKRHNISDSLGDWFRDSGLLADALVIDRKKDKYRSGPRKLQFMAKHYGIDFNEEEAHNARYDVEKTAQVTAKVLQKFGTPSTKEQSNWYREWATGFEEYKKRSDPDFVMDNFSWPLQERV